MVRFQPVPPIPQWCNGNISDSKPDDGSSILSWGVKFKFMMVLNELEVNEKAKVVAINIKNNNAIRIMTLGIIEQTEVKMLSKTSGSVEVLIHNRAMAMSNDIAQDIIVVRS